MVHSENARAISMSCLPQRTLEAEFMTTLQVILDEFRAVATHTEPIKDLLKTLEKSFGKKSSKCFSWNSPKSFKILFSSLRGENKKTTVFTNKVPVVSGGLKISGGAKTSGGLSGGVTGRAKISGGLSGGANANIKLPTIKVNVKKIVPNTYKYRQSNDHHRPGHPEDRDKWVQKPKPNPKLDRPAPPPRCPKGDPRCYPPSSKPVISGGTKLSGGLKLSGGAKISGGLSGGLSGGANLSIGRNRRLQGLKKKCVEAKTSGGAKISGKVNLSGGAKISGGLGLSGGVKLSGGVSGGAKTAVKKTVIQLKMEARMSARKDM